MEEYKQKHKQMMYETFYEINTLQIDERYYNSTIYQIQHKKVKSLNYIGSTIDFNLRKQQHINDAKKKHTKLYKTIKENGGFDNFEMKILRKFPCNNEIQMFNEEFKTIDTYKPSMNSCFLRNKRKNHYTYKNGIIYIIFCKTNDTLFYIGSTKNFYDRLVSHRNACNNKKYKNYKLYKIINENGGFDNFVVAPLYNYPCRNQRELELQERLAYDMYKPTLNRCIPHTTKEEKVEITNRKSRILYNSRKNDKTYMKKLSDRAIVSYHKKRENLPPKPIPIYKTSEEMRNQKKENRHKNKTLFNCGCGSDIMVYFEKDKRVHFDSKKHKKWLNENNTI